MNIAPDTSYTIYEAARAIGSTYSTLYSAIRRGKLHAYQDWNWFWHVRGDDLIAFVERLAIDRQYAELQQTIKAIQESQAWHAKKKHREQERAERDRAKAAAAYERQARQQGKDAEAMRCRVAAVVLPCHATDYAKRSILANEDQQGRQILARLTSYPGVDPAARSSDIEMSDASLFIRGLRP